MAGVPVNVLEEDRERAKQLLLFADQEGWTAFQFILACSLIADAVLEEYGAVLERPSQEEEEVLESQLH
jgi:hypothetical protein